MDERTVGDNVTGVNSRKQELTAHLMLFLLCGGVVAASMILSPTDAVVALGGFDIPELCIWRRMTGHSCPGCGMTRSFTYMGHGQIFDAFRLHTLGPFLYTLVAVQIPLRAWRMWQSR
ncbi:MAG: hypothetical protein ACI8RZ_000635 [Myxococcota bacterium]